MTASRNVFTKEVLVEELFGRIELDGASNVIAFVPVGAGQALNPPYSRVLGLGNSINGTNGVTAVQPHTSTGVYTFVLDGASAGLLDWHVSLDDGYGAGETTDLLHARLQGANVSGQTGQPQTSFLKPGCTQTLAAKTVVITFQTTGGNFKDPPPNTGFYIRLTLLKAGNP